MGEEKLSILVFTIEYSDDSEQYSENWINCKFSDQNFIKVLEGSTVGDLCEIFKSPDNPKVFALKPYVTYTAVGIIDNIKPTEFIDGMVKPEDPNKVLDGTEVYNIIKSNLDGSNINDFIYLK